MWKGTHNLKGLIHSMWFPLGDTHQSRLLLEWARDLAMCFYNSRNAPFDFLHITKSRSQWENICVNDICYSFDSILQNRSFFHTSTMNTRRKHVKGKKKIIYIATIKNALLQYYNIFMYENWLCVCMCSHHIKWACLHPESFVTSIETIVCIVCSQHILSLSKIHTLTLWINKYSLVFFSFF